MSGWLRKQLNSTDGTRPGGNHTPLARDGIKFINTIHAEIDNPMLLILQDKGYELSMSFHLDVAYQRFETWHAEGHGWKHSADTVARLLANVIVAESRGVEWPRRRSEPDLVTLIRSQALDLTDPETRHQF